MEVGVYHGILSCHHFQQRLITLLSLVADGATPGTWRYIQYSHWSSFYIAALSLVENFRVLKYFHELKGPIIDSILMP